MLQVLKAGGEPLLSLLEEPTTLTLAAGLLGLDETDDARVGRGGGCVRAPPTGTQTREGVEAPR